MTQTEFLTALKSISGSYRWVYDGTQLVGVTKYGKHRGCKFNPITAVARSYGLDGYYANDIAATLEAAVSLKLNSDLAHAVLSRSNRGHAQIIRGRMVKLLSNKE